MEKTRRGLPDALSQIFSTSKRFREGMELILRGAEATRTAAPGVKRRKTQR